MKVIALFIFFGLLILPRFFALAGALYLGLNRPDSSVTQPQTQPQMKTRRKWPYWVLAIYWLLLTSTLLWTIYLFAIDSGVKLREIIFVATWVVFCLASFVVPLVIQYKREIKTNPHPPYHTKEFLDWQNRSMDEGRKHFWPKFLKFMLISVAIFFVDVGFGVVLIKLFRS
jgi:uncharacterized membrane protein YhaH (DUF805 family)